MLVWREAALEEDEIATTNISKEKRPGKNREVERRGAGGESQCLVLPKEAVITKPTNSLSNQGGRSLLLGFPGTRARQLPSDAQNCG